MYKKAHKGKKHYFAEWAEARTETDDKAHTIHKDKTEGRDAGWPEAPAPFPQTSGEWGVKKLALVSRDFNHFTLLEEFFWKFSKLRFHLKLAVVCFVSGCLGAFPSCGINN